MSQQRSPLPKADLHVHQEPTRRLDRVLAAREGHPSYDWAGWRRQLVDQYPPGFERLRMVGSVNPVPLADHDADLFVARYLDLLLEAGAAGAWYVEIHCDASVIMRDRFMELFRVAERRAQEAYPHLRAEVIAMNMMMAAPEHLVAVADTCLRLREEGLAGVDFLYTPYHLEADWTEIYRLAERYAAAGLGITAHAGEASTANIAAAARTPGLTRIGHGIHAATDPALIEILLERQITLEVCLSCNAFFGVLPRSDQHSLLDLLDAGVWVTLATDNPVQLDTDIDQEYAAAKALGLSDQQLEDITRNAYRASFTTEQNRLHLLAGLDQAEPELGTPQADETS